MRAIFNMRTTFKNLCEKQHFDRVENFTALQKWCHTHVSSDRHFTGKISEQHADYLKLARDYLDNFLINQSAANTQSGPSFDGLTTIQYAAKQGYDHYLAGLTRISPAAVNQPTTENGMTPLHLAATGGHLNAVKTLLKLGADAKIVNKNNNELPIFSALFVPTLHDEGLMHRKELIFDVLNTAAPGHLTHQDTSGNTVFHLMAASDFTKLLAKAIDQEPSGLSINNNTTKYPIHTAILNGQLEIVDLLLKNPGVIQLTDYKGRNALHYAAQYASEDIILQRCCQAVTDIDVVDNEHKTPLMLATLAEKRQAMTSLVTLGANVDATDAHGNSILHLAIDNMDKDFIEWILDKIRIDINHSNDNGQTPLAHLIAEHSGEIYFTEIEHLLLDHGGQASINRP